MTDLLNKAIGDCPLFPSVRPPPSLRPMPDALQIIGILLVDGETHESYVLLPADEFQRLKTASEDDLGDTYRAQVESAMQAGWDDPRIGEYNDYDAHRRRA